MYKWIINAFFFSILIGCGSSTTSSVTGDDAENFVNIIDTVESNDIDDLVDDSVNNIEDNDVIDTDVIDTDVIDTDVIDNDVIDTDVIDTDVIDTDVIDTDVIDTVIDYSQIACEDTLSSVVGLMNEKRAQAQVCGTTNYPAVPALELNAILTLASQGHADNMANYDFFAHEGLDGLSVNGRVDELGYAWFYVGENIAAGYFSAESVIDGWMNSEGHCKNMMSANFTEVGLACTVNNDSIYKTYWVQSFAKPK